MVYDVCVYGRIYAFANTAMVFRSQPHTHMIGIAPSGRATCRKCKGRVSKGSVRIATTAFVRPGRSTVFVRHPECVDDVFATALLAVYGTTARVRVGKDVGEVDASHVRKLIESRVADP